MPSLERSLSLPLAAALALGTATWFTADRVIAGTEGFRAYDVRLIPRGESLALASPGIRLSVANWYWLSTVQYVGDRAAQEAGLPKVYPLVDLVTTLDPRHGYAYQTAGILLSIEHRLDESDAILKKGMERGPNWWSYPFYIAFNHFFYRGDYAEGARWAEIAARTPGASTNISHLAMALKVKSGSPDDALRFLEEMQAVAKDDVIRRALEEQYRIALLERDVRRLDDAVAEYRRRTGREPATLREVELAGIARVPRRDPFDGVYELRDGAVQASGRPRLKPPEPGRLAPRPPETPPLLRRR